MRLASVLAAGDLLVMTGPLGAGKTTLTRGIGRGMHVRGQVASPTFVLARTHPALSAEGVPLVHVDAYRLGSAAELDDLDLDFAGSVVVVEWGAGLLDGVAESWLEVGIERPVGAGAGEGADAAGAGAGAADAGVAGAAAVAAGVSALAADLAPELSLGAATVDEAADESVEEPRVVTIMAHGPRWSGVVLPA
ncbi:tRNA (adenosine(37)-N6)-threonylcarbamoyltransferase complex ATPase subunit type 1 TsaE [Frondihabitans cladoniiphilus]|uniref:tRNA threonylcarbamoyladenosine biosynthesis protein TsaE n=1 Tax=Frondihabitans cladoniiphilus TaxID=715785 RepID=A0ABP8VXP6_9MICO